MNFSSPQDPFSCSANLRAVAQKMFNQMRLNACVRQAWSLIGGRRSMPSLAERIAGRGISAQHSLGLRAVEIRHIVGTESRADDFDPLFNPRADRMRERWVRIAELRLRQAGLPAIDLIQVGGEYFVRDGHHRVSVARILGNAYIDANVTVIELG